MWSDAPESIIKFVSEFVGDVRGKKEVVILAVGAVGERGKRSDSEKDEDDDTELMS